MSERVFFDTNVLLDVLLGRVPFLAAAQRLWTLAERGQIVAVVSAVSFLNVYYVVRRLASRQQADQAIAGMHSIFQVSPVDRKIIEAAMASRSADFEDAVQDACAVAAGTTCIITRDKHHFAGSALPIMTPNAFLAKRTL